MFRPFMTTGIGSLPHTDPQEACELVFDTCDIPFWPQLPKLSFRELMISQFSEGLPFLRIDNQKKNIWVEKDSSDDLMRFYEIYSEDWTSKISEEFAKGFYTFIQLLKNKRFPFLKGQVTGPLTFTLGLKDSEGRPIYFDEELRETSLLLLKAKIRWQIEMLRPYAEYILLFIDEPILSALGTTSYLGVEPREAQRLLKETSDAIKHAGGISGIHCCGKADWQMVVKSETDIISFDAYDYIDSLSLYPEDFTAFLRAGGYLAWGIVPTTDAISEENDDSIKKRFSEGSKRLSQSLPTDLLLSHILLTPSCGTGSMSREKSTKVFKLLISLKESLT